MIDEQQTDEALKADESQIDVESPATEEVPVADQVEEVAEVSTEEEANEGTTEESNRKTASSRIRELVAEKKEAVAKAESLAEQVKKFTAPQPQSYAPQMQQDDASELTVDEVLQRADAMTSIRLAQQENIHRVQNEAVDAIKSHPELDPDSESFDAELSEVVSQATLARIQANPTAPVKEFVNSLMKPYKRAVEKEARGQADVLTKQASQQAMRPTQVREQEKPFSELTPEEMKARLGVVYH
jgi:hypothetical protein